MTQYKHRAFLIVTEAERPTQRIRWTSLAPAGPAEAATFTAPLSADGFEPVTHFGASSAFTGAMQRSLVEGNNMGLMYYVVNPPGILRFTNSPVVQIGTAFTWADALADMGLQPAMPPGP